MSRKTIAFTMPAAGRRSRDGALIDLDAPAHESASFAADDPSAGDAAIAAESEEWVQDRDLRRAAAGAGATIDLAAERSLAEVVSLSLLVPFALGWFWLVNAIGRRDRMWGA